MSLAAAIDYHFDGNPPEGISTVDGVITAWPAAAGAQPDEATLSGWVDSWLEREKQTLVNDERDRRIGGGFVFGGKEYQTDAGSRENISGAQGLSLGAMITDPQGSAGYRWSDPYVDFTWTAADNSAVLMTAAQCQAFCMVAMEYKTALIKAARSLKDMQPIPQDYNDDKHWPSRTLS